MLHRHNSGITCNLAWDNGVPDVHSKQVRFGCCSTVASGIPQCFVPCDGLHPFQTNNSLVEVGPKPSGQTSKRRRRDYFPDLLEDVAGPTKSHKSKPTR
jgi:hypothetical protein